MHMAHVHEFAMLPNYAKIKCVDFYDKFVIENRLITLVIMFLK